MTDTTPPPPTVPKPEFTLTHVIENVSQLSTTRRYSPAVSLLNVPWRVAYLKLDGSLIVQLYCGHNSASPWSVDTSCRLTFTSPGGKISNTGITRFVFGRDGRFLANGNTIRWDIFMDTYVLNDRTVIDACVTINEISGIEKPPRLREFSDETKGDVALVAGGEKFHVSKLYLASVSPYFNSLFLGPYEENGKAEIELKEVDPEHFQVYLELIHMEPTLTDSNIESVMTLVDMYDTKNAHRLCEDFLMHKSTNSSKNKLRMAQKFKMQRLKDYCISSMKNTAEVRASISLDLEPAIREALFQKSLTF